MSLSGYCIYVVFLIDILNTNFVIGAGCLPPDLISPCRCLMKAGEYQVWCSHSDLSKVLAGLRSLSQHIKSPIDELILENNYLPSLPGRTFSTLKILRLMVRQNGLERVSHDWLSGQEGILMELFIVEPKLRYLPDESLSRLNALEAITIQTNDLKRLPQISSLAKLRYLQIESAALDELSPRNFKNLPVLEKIHISKSSNLKRLEAGLFDDLPFLKLINISYCGINWLHPRTFGNLPMIQEISMKGNNIQDAGMVGRSSKDLTSLQTISLDFNEISILYEGSFVDIPSLQTLHLSFNYIVEIHRGAFHRVPNLKKLYLNNNILKRIHPDSFLQPSNSGLEELWMTNNNISHISEVKSLLDTLPRLIFLDMSYNKLEIMPFGSLRGHPTLEVLKLNHNRVYQIDKELFMAMPALRELGLRNNSLTNFNQEPLWNLPSLKGLDISHNHYRRIEPLFLANLPSLRRLDISENELVTIDPISFSSTPLIEFVNISFNELQFIHPATFKNLNNLYELDLSGNQVEEFLVELPKGLEYLHLNYNKLKMLPFISGTRELFTLRYLDISDNFIEKMYPYNLKIFPSLRKLFIRNNIIHRLEEGLFESLSKLEVLDLSRNKISHVYPNSFRNVNNLMELNLGNNNIESILPALLQKMPKLLKLDVSRNRLVDFVRGSLSHIPYIKVLNISGNFLVTMPQNIFKMKHIRTLDLSQNRIKFLPTGDFSKLEDLVNFRISDNYFEELKTGTFNNLKKLRIVYLDHNAIDNIETNSFHSLPSLEMIRLDSNKLSKIPSYAFNNLTILQIAEFQHNLLKTVSNNAFNLVPNLLVLNLSYNQLPSVEDAGLRGLPSLEVLDLSNNVISKIDSKSFRRMEWLVEIRMDSNNICGIIGAPFNNMPRLRVISMKKNKMSRISEKVLDKIRTNLAVFDVDENPLDCDCSALWLQVWSEESLTLGPHCSDGSLLRELKFIPSQCKQHTVEDILTNCDTDNFQHHTSQIFSKYTFRNISDGERTNNLAPLPQDSEYFYDEYVDYPFNESLTTALNEKEGILDRFVRVNHSSLLVPQKSSHVISGDTPTLYAASSTNKTKHDIPKEVPHSPSSSGFTFFGVPLPSLNLNQLLGGDKTSIPKKSEKSQSIPVADRKVAIMNTPTTARVTSQNMFRPPPVFPKIETGGFVPMLPGDGGFQPITVPTLMKPDEIKEENVKNSSFSIQKSSIAHMLPVQDQKSSKTEIKNSRIPPNPPNGTDSDPSGKTTSKPAISTVSNTKISPSNSLKVENITFENTTPGSDKNVKLNPFQETTSNTSNTMGKFVNNTVSIRKDVTESTTEGRGLVKKDIQSKFQSKNILTQPPKFQPTSVKHTTASSTDIPVIVTQKTKNGELTLDKIANVNNASDRLENSSSLSTFLVPGGQQPYIRPSGRPTITKVQSPYTTVANTPSEREYHVKNMKVISDIKKGTVENGMRNGETVTLDPEITKLDEVKENWYFANYNKTYSEPFYGAISSAGTRIRNYEFCVIFLFFQLVYGLEN